MSSSDIFKSWFDDFGEVSYYDNTAADEIAERVADADIVIANKAPMNESVLENLNSNLIDLSYHILMSCLKQN